jgi:hypothetical protein
MTDVNKDYLLMSVFCVFIKTSMYEGPFWHEYLSLLSFLVYF